MNSLHGQITLPGRDHGNLAGKTINLLVKFDQHTSKQEYAIQETLQLINDYNNKNENKIQATFGVDKKLESPFAGAPLFKNAFEYS